MFYKKERAGRLFDFKEGGIKKYTFDFGSVSGGEIITDKLSEIDEALSSVFSKRVEELGTTGRRIAKIT